MNDVPLQQTLQTLENLNSDLLTKGIADTDPSKQSNTNLTPEIISAVDTNKRSDTEPSPNQKAVISVVDTEQITFSKPSPLKPVKSLVPVNPLAGTLTSGLFGWITENEFLHKVAEKAISSVDTVITTLDPGMKEVLCMITTIRVV